MSMEVLEAITSVPCGTFLSSKYTTQSEDKPSVLAPPEHCKQCLKGLRKLKLVDKYCARFMLHADARKAWRAYQVKESAKELIRLAGTDLDQNDEDAGWLASMFGNGSIKFQQHFQAPRHVLGENPFAYGKIKWLTEGSGMEMRKVTSRAFTFSEIFAGIGGFGVALTGLNGRCVLACEVDKSAIEVYRLNHGVQAEIRSVVGLTDAPIHDILTGGFPCQSFTTSGDQRGFLDVRGMLFWHMLHVVKRSNPRAILLENVTGFASFAKGVALSAALQALSSLGYHVSYKVINSHEATAQFRERLYIVGIRDDYAQATFHWPVSFPIAHGKQIEDILEHGDQPAYTIPSALWTRVQESKFYQASPQRRIPRLDGPANTLRASYRSGANKYSQFVGSLDSDGLPRFFTPRECLRLQGFPDTFKLGNVNDFDAYRLIGNAVSPPIVQAIATAILSHIFPVDVVENK